ncbi:MAG: hypothetical protein ACRDTQ_06365, partial [Micromonosporaceae bacterium]
LHPGGALAVISAGAHAMRPARLIQAAATAGLVYSQHIAQLTAPIQAQHSAGPARKDSKRSTPPGAGGLSRPHVHAHIYVFTTRPDRP